MEVSLMKFDLKKAIHEVTYIDVNRPFIYSLHPTPEGKNLYSVPVQGANFKMITSAIARRVRHEGYI